MSQSQIVIPLVPTHLSNEVQEQAIPLASSINYKFFEPIVLLLALTDAIKSTAKPPPPEASIDILDSKQLFCAFINKLGHVCDSKKGGSTVTSFIILRQDGNPDYAHYVFAANCQTIDQLKATSSYVKTLLQHLSQPSGNHDSQREVRRLLFYDVLRFNRPRITSYLRDLHSQATSCLTSCRTDDTCENQTISEALVGVLDTGAEPGGSEASYFRKCETTIQLLIRIENSSVGKLIMERALEDRIAGFSSMECWSNLLHTMRRILAYPQSIQFFLLAKERWPKLFQDVLVSFVSSSQPTLKPKRNKSLTAEGIVGRMTRKEKEIRIFRDFAHKLQTFDLDGRIQNEYAKDSFRPIVHSEVLLLNWVFNHGQVDATNFFNDRPYIGSSKPTCKLCYYYLQEHPCKIEHRTTHGNLYPSWRVPDVFPHQGQEALDKRQNMVDRILQRVRKDAFDIVRKKALPSVKENDSNTFSARVTLEEIWSLNGSRADVEEVSSLFGEVTLD